MSFPTQTLFKSSKVIPVMLVGKFFHKKSYPWIEYVIPASERAPSLGDETEPDFRRRIAGRLGLVSTPEE